MLQSTRHGHDDSHQHDDDGEDDGAVGVVGQRVEHLCAGEDVEADEEDVVGKQHHPSEFVGNAALPKDVVTKVTFRSVRRELV